MNMETDYLSALGAGAGFDTKKIVTTIVAAEKASKQSSIDRRTTDVEARISGMAQLKSSLVTLQTAFEKVDDKRDFNFSALSNSAPESVYASFDASNSVPGTYKVNVSQLAQNDVFQSSSYTSQTADQNGGAAASVSIQVGNNAVETVSLAAGSATLNDLAAGINALDADVTARVVETSTGVYRLLLEGPQGADHKLTITDGVFGLSSGVNQLQSAQDSSLTVNGLLITRPTNEVSDVIPGLKLDLVSTTSTEVVLSVNRDTTAAKSAITNLVDAFNAFDAVMKNLTGSMNADGEVGSLKSDSTIRAIRQTVKDFLTADSSTPGVSRASLSSIGVALQQDGSFKVDEAALGTALTNDYSDIALMFSANTNDQSVYSTDSRGMAGDIVLQISTYLGFGGLVETRDAGYVKTKSGLTDEQVALDKKMDGVKERYTKQFSTMSKIMDEMKSTQKYLESQLDNLPFTSKNN